MAARLESARVSTVVEVADRLGDDRVRRFDLRFPKLRSFTTDSLVRSTPLLSELASLSSHVSAKQILPGMERLVGRGRLYRAVEEADRSHDSQTPAAKSAPSLEALLRSVAIAHGDREKLAARAVDVFVRASREQAAQVVAAPRKPVRSPHAVLEEAVRQTAHDLLASVAALESAWRGLKLLVDQLPSDGSILLEVVDARESHELDVLQMREHDSRLERPDVVLLVAQKSAPEHMRACAQHAERLEAVCIIALEPSILGADSLEALRREREGSAHAAFHALRNQESARWLCVSANPVLLHSEEDVGCAPRLVFGSSAWGLAALLVAAQREHQRYTRMLGPEMLLRAPTFWIPARGADAGMALPTAEFCSVRAQTELGERGIAALGSTRRGDELLASRAPTAFAGSAPQSLASQLLIGRLLRATRVACGRMPEGASDAVAQERCEQGMRQCIPPGLEHVVQLEIAVERIERKRRICVSATATRFEALTPFEIVFSLEC